MHSWYPGGSFLSYDRNWKVDCQEMKKHHWDCRGWYQQSNPDLFFIYYLFQALGVAGPLQDKKTVSVPRCILLRSTHIVAVLFGKLKRQSLLLACSLSPSETRRNRYNLRRGKYYLEIRCVWEVQCCQNCFQYKHILSFLIFHGKFWLAET